MKREDIVVGALYVSKYKHTMTKAPLVVKCLCFDLDGLPVFQCIDRENIGSDIDFFSVHAVQDWSLSDWAPVEVKPM